MLIFSQSDSLTSDIGGQLGLFVGMSIMTITEFVELFATLFVACFSKGKSKTETVPQDNGEATDGYPVRTHAEGQMTDVEITK